VRLIRGNTACFDRQTVSTTIAIFTTAVSKQAFENPTIPKSGVFCKEDASLPPGTCLGMAPGLGDYKLIKVADSHETLLTEPAIVTEGLIDAL
jgi:hypothetical protein